MKIEREKSMKEKEEKNQKKLIDYFIQSINYFNSILDREERKKLMIIKSSLFLFLLFYFFISILIIIFL